MRRQRSCAKNAIALKFTKLSFSFFIREQICILGKNITMCPLCDTCEYWHLSDICKEYKIAILFDNSATLFFAIFMSLWAVSFIEYWKRQNVKLAYQWNCLEFEEEEVA